MTKDEVIHLFNKEQRIEITYPGFRREEVGQVVRQVSLEGEDGFVLYSDLEQGTVEEVVREQLAYFQKLNQTFEWKAYDYDKPDNLVDILRAYGFEIGDPEALLVMQLHEGHPLLTWPIPTEIRQVTEDAGIDDIILLEEEIWNEPHEDLGERLKRDLRDDSEDLSIYAAYAGGKVVSAAWMYLHHGTSFGSLWGGSTLPDYRRKGLYTSLLAARAQAAWHKGFRLLTVDASPLSRPILEKHGFEFLGYSYPCVSPAQLS
ncbi:GNAT family N-acetyltransferase [Cohnella terricola]|uniref:GNAT family N-acetyltransferase n=1 Tax=Cohnella terricola TaxID=1289167 RepID=A0A559JIS0_9BACL|nr:GNAT family N-acetyltransferase [Cohnella terricola]TVX99766.1 GNAT family N-acetyltransferase [Cohnella terricola]